MQTMYRIVWGPRLVLERDHGLIIETECSHPLQPALGLGHGSHRTIAVDGMAIFGRIPAAAGMGLLLLMDSIYRNGRARATWEPGIVNENSSAPRTFMDKFRALDFRWRTVLCVRPPHRKYSLAVSAGPVSDLARIPVAPGFISRRYLGHRSLHLGVSVSSAWA